MTEQAKASAPNEPDIKPEEELQTIANSQEDTVALKDGTVVSVQRCRLRHAPATARLAQTVLSYLNVTSLDDLDNLEDLAAINDPSMLAAVVEFAYEPLATAVAQMTDLEKDAFEDLELDDAILVIAKVVEVNQSFFSNQVKSVLSGLRKSVPREESPESEESPSS